MEVCYKACLEEDRGSAMNIITVSSIDSAAFSAKLSSSDSDKQNEKLTPICTMQKILAYDRTMLEVTW